MYHFWCIMLYFKKGKNATETNKDLCTVWRRCCHWSNMSKVVCEVSWSSWQFGQIILFCGAVLCIRECLAAPPCLHLTDSNSRRWPTHSNIQINKVIDENEKCDFILLEKKPKQTFWPTKINSQVIQFTNLKFSFNIFIMFTEWYSHYQYQFKKISMTSKRNPAALTVIIYFPHPVQATANLLCVSVDLNLFCILDIKRITQNTAFCAWVFVTRIIFSVFIHTVVCIST